MREIVGSPYDDTITGTIYCEYTIYSDARTAEGIQTAMARILEFMELDALYR